MNGRLSLSTAFDGQKTITEDLYFAPPFKVYSPFYDHKGWAKYISMCGSAGVLAGDENEIKLFVGENCKVRGECGGKIVAAAFNENDLRVRVLFHHFVNGFQVH